MTSSFDGLQFPLHPKTNKISTSTVGKNILSAALAPIDANMSQAIKSEKHWRKTYPQYFKALVEYGIRQTDDALNIAQIGLSTAHQSFNFHRQGQSYNFSQIMSLETQPLSTFKLQGDSDAEPEWYVPYQGQKLQGSALLTQIKCWQQRGIIEPSHAHALEQVIAHPEWLDLSDRTMVLFGAGSEAGPLTWLSKWKANIVAVDLQHEAVWEKILKTIQQGNATLYAPSTEVLDPETSIAVLKSKLGANLLTQTPEIAQWLINNPNRLDLAAIAYLDGEKHVRVAMAMDAIMQQVSQYKPDTSLMFMCTPTDIYAVPAEVTQAAQRKFSHRSIWHKGLTQAISQVTRQHFFSQNNPELIHSNNQLSYGIADCLVVEQGPNYALAKRIQQWRATLARTQGQTVSINIAPSTTTHSVTKNPLLKAAFHGASLFDVEAFSPETTNALMAALWIYDLRDPQSVAQPNTQLQHPLELMMSGANHGGLWRVAYLARSALPFAALYGFATEKLPFLERKK
ncbi:MULTISPECIES: hypothetical protein [unclassified Acinetobacter]|uniref:hypothetical protein n=1 Tax=unclassified Acinetobacter TaxID=196816 RepID=UPI0029350A47|nr:MULTISPECIES: hypothetical protein [unclassified Acinetobacter]WOE31441.1 hypothetical protein QSG84_14185 [Acinetobacter sp. SAAs470]WOE39637.1 hypothetical protein QSG86_07850 [Acinetobacter sp. SAAs474]